MRGIFGAPYYSLLVTSTADMASNMINITMFSVDVNLRSSSSGWDKKSQEVKMCSLSVGRFDMDVPVAVLCRPIDFYLKNLLS